MRRIQSARGNASGRCDSLSCMGAAPHTPLLFDAAAAIPSGESGSTATVVGLRNRLFPAYVDVAAAE